MSFESVSSCKPATVTSVQKNGNSGEIIVKQNEDYWTEVDETHLLDIKKEPKCEIESDDTTFDNNELLVERKIKAIGDDDENPAKQKPNMSIKAEPLGIEAKPIANENTLDQEQSLDRLAIKKESPYNNKLLIENVGKISKNTSNMIHENKIKRERLGTETNSRNCYEVPFDPKQQIVRNVKKEPSSENKLNEEIHDKNKLSVEKSSINVYNENLEKLAKQIAHNIQEKMIKMESLENENHQGEESQETPLERKRRLGRERIRRWLAKQNAERLEEIRRKNRESLAKRRSQMEENEKAIRRQLDARRKALSIANETEEQKKARRKSKAESMAKRKANETEEERERRKRLDAEAKARSRAIMMANETEEEKKARKRLLAEARAKKRANETEEEKIARKKLDAERKKKIRAKKMQDMFTEKDHFINAEFHLGDDTNRGMRTVDDYLEIEIKPSCQEILEIQMFTDKNESPPI